MDPESTATEQPAEGSIDADLAAAMADYDTEETETEDAVDETEETEDTETEEETESEETEEDDKEADEDKGEEKTGDEKLEAPDHWPPADKEAFAKAPKDIQEWALRREKDMTADYTRKTTEAANIRKFWEPVAQVFAPHMDKLQQQGIHPAQVIQNWAQIDQSLRNDPAGTIQWLASQYGVTGEEQPQNPEVAALRQQLGQLTQQMQQREKTEAQQRLSTIQNDLQSFADEKTEAGELAHPYFDDVMDTMVMLARAEKAEGREPKLQTLYEQAVWATPEIREKIISSQRQAEEEQRAKEARAKAAKAKKAASSVTGSPGGASTGGDLTLEQELAQAFNS